METGRRRGEPGSPLVDLLRNGKFAAVAEPGLAIARSIDGHAENDVVLSVAINAPGDGQTRFSNGSKLPIAQ